MESFFPTRSGRRLVLSYLSFLLAAGCVSLDSNSTDCRTTSNGSSLAGNMASMEGYLNRLFRQIGSGTIDESSEQAAISLLALQRESVGIVPEAWCELDAVERARLKGEYRARALQMVELLEDFLVHVRNRNLNLANEWLERIDQHRRECHVRFG